MISHWNVNLLKTLQTSALAKGTFLLFVFSLTACSLEANIESLTELPKSLIENPIEKVQRTETDFVAGEVVTTTNGAVIMGTFGEISERQELSNGVVIEGAFYE